MRKTLETFQDQVCEALEAQDGEARFRRDEIERPGGGRSRPRVLEGGPVVERSAVNFSHTLGNQLPPAATERRPELAGGTYEAVSTSLIVHPRNPYAPTSHANFRFFSASKEDVEPVWWFGGGFDLTPYYGFDEDVVHWHTVARDACMPFGDDLYARCKAACDAYFTLPHRSEPRGVGGLFFDDFETGGFETAFGFVKAAAGAYLDAYLPILERRKHTPYSDRERSWQLLRRGRYVEFNLIHDRGTRFGLQAGARTESLLASLPPEVRWEYDHRPEPGSPEARLLDHYLVPRDWV
ncbi:oxygen-dependent coproporphyrinogen oxidase [Myxococcota bacterium]|nr:oxygen-dependent coproporphyrinogen oxidase [Myxococcota bacterium]